MSALQPRLKLARVICQGTYICLLLTLLANAVALDRPLTIIVITLIPLLLFARGVWREDPRSLILLCFVVLMYFATVVINLGKPTRSGFDWLELVLITALFISAMMFSRWKSMSLAAARSE